MGMRSPPFLRPLPGGGAIAGIVPLFVLQLVGPLAIVVVGTRFVEGDARLEDVHQRVAGMLQGLADQPPEVLKVAGKPAPHKGRAVGER
jgi:hypothetical protein